MPSTTPEVTTISEEEEKKADDFGIKIPSSDCIISWDQFKENVNEPRHVKTNIVRLRPTWIQMSLRIRAVSSGAMMFAFRPYKRCRSFKRTARIRRLIWIHVVRKRTMLVFTWRGSCKNYAEIYDIDDDDKLFPGGITKAKLHFRVLNDTTIRRDATVRIAAIDMCAFFFGIEERVDANKAIFRPLTGNSLVFPGRKDYVVSLDPSKYIFYFFCYEESKNGRCPVGIVILLIEDKREWTTGGDGIPEGELSINNLSLGEIENTMRKCFGQQFVDDTPPQVDWVWKGRECPNPLSDVHRKAVMDF